jgi:ubiquinone biosynthesis protein COQ4
MDDRPPLYEGHYRTNVAQKALLAVGSAIGALIDPYRSDLVASLGESTGAFALARLRSRMANDPTGAVILAERPR